MKINKIYPSIIFALILSAGISRTSAAPEEIPGTNLTVDFSESVLSGAGRLIRATNIPVQSAGTTVYYDVEMDFSTLADGSFGAKLISATPSTGPVSPTSVSTMNFLPGTYAGIVSGAPATALPCFFSLESPSIGAEGRRTYLLTITSSETGCPVGVTSYSWQTGPAVNNSIISSGFSRAGSNFETQSSLTYSYGAEISSAGSTIRTQQIGNTLTIEQVNSSASALSGGKKLTLIKQ